MPVNEAVGSRRDVRALAAFVIGYALVDLLPVVLVRTPAFKGLSLGDVVDLALIFLLAGLYIGLAQRANLWRSSGLRAAFSVTLVLMVQGHAVHLAANAIAGVSRPTDAGWTLIYFLDERWGHLELHLSFLIIAAMFIAWAEPEAGASGPTLSVRDRVTTLALASVYGLLLAGDAIEGQTVPLMLPVAIVLSIWGVCLRPARSGPLAGRTVPVYRRFFSAALGVTVLALLVYGLFKSGFPQLSEAGYLLR